MKNQPTANGSIRVTTADGKTRFYDARELRIMDALPAKLSRAARRRLSASKLTAAQLRRVNRRRRSWHALKAAWEQSMLANLDPHVDARADLAADRAADWNEAGF